MADQLETSQLGIDLIKHYEGVNDSNLMKIGLQPKPDVIGIITAGYGRALRDLDGKFLRGAKGYARMMEIYPELDNMTYDDAEKMLREDLQSIEKLVNSLGLTVSQNQFDALVSFTFNCGFSALKTSTLIKRITGKDSGSIEEAFLMWNKSGGKEYKGLTLRRKSEYILYSEGRLDFVC
jgi:lysozyme